MLRLKAQVEVPCGSWTLQRGLGSPLGLRRPYHHRCLSAFFTNLETKRRDDREKAGGAEKEEDCLKLWCPVLNRVEVPRVRVTSP